MTFFFLSPKHPATVGRQKERGVYIIIIPFDKEGGQLHAGHSGGKTHTVIPTYCMYIIYHGGKT